MNSSFINHLSGPAGLRMNRRGRRAVVRHGQWLFMPRPALRVQPALIRSNEPLQRGGSEPHWVDECVRLEVEPLYVSRVAPEGFNERSLLRWREINRDIRDRVQWQIRRRDPRVFVRGRLRHADCQAVLLPGWHEVFVNAESQSPAGCRIPQRA